MTAADKLRELLASRPAMPNTEELVRWWRSSAELVRELLEERHEFMRATMFVENLVGSPAPDGYSAPDRIRHAAHTARIAINEQRAAVDVLKQEVRELEQQRDAARAVPPSIFEHGFWRSCSGCHESNEGHPTGPYSDTFRCNLGSGCHECGGLGATWEQLPDAPSLLDGQCPAGFVCVHEVKCHG